MFLNGVREGIEQHTSTLATFSLINVQQSAGG